MPLPLNSASAVVNVGDEILLGEAPNDNQRWMLETLREHGMAAAVAMSLPDDVATIAHWIDRLKAAGSGPVFVSGGIGGTHDDHSREGIARGLGVALQRHESCFEILLGRYGDRFNAQRQRMADLPAGCELIANPIGAPGFHLDGVFAFPGFPTMLQPMMLQVLAGQLVDVAGEAWVSEQFVLPVAEGEIAAEIEAFATAHRSAKIGIYPSSRQLGRELTLRIRTAPDRVEILHEFRELVARLRG